MVKKTGIMMSALFASGMLLAVQASAETVDVKTIAKHLDKGKYTKSEIKDYMKDMKGKEVTAEGHVNDIERGKRNEKIVVWVDVPGREKKFVVDALVEDASGFHMNDAIACKGNFSKYNIFSLNGVTIKDAKCTKR
jgi:hypothetical protein